MTNKNTTNDNQQAPKAPELQKEQSNDTISETGNTDVAPAAGNGKPEDTAGIVEQQKAMIDNLLQQTASLQNQINVLLRNGASVTDNNAQNGNNVQQDDTTQQEYYVSLADLGKEIGRREYRNVNLEGD